MASLRAEKESKKEQLKLQGEVMQLREELMAYKKRPTVASASLQQVTGKATRLSAEVEAFYLDGKTREGRQMDGVTQVWVVLVQLATRQVQ